MSPARMTSPASRDELVDILRLLGATMSVPHRRVSGCVWYDVQPIFLRCKRQTWEEAIGELDEITRRYAPKLARWFSTWEHHWNSGYATCFGHVDDPQSDRGCLEINCAVYRESELSPKLEGGQATGVTRDELIRLVRRLGARPGVRYCRSPPDGSPIEEIWSTYLSCPRERWVELFGEPQHVLERRDARSGQPILTWEQASAVGPIRCAGHLFVHSSDGERAILQQMRFRVSAR